MEAVTEEGIDRNLQILQKYGLPEPPGTPLELKFVMGNGDWYCRTEEGWWYCRTQDVITKKWQYCPNGPEYY